jgi:hypothetical protein
LELHPLACQLLIRSGRARIGHEIAELTSIASVAEWGFETKRFADEPTNGMDFLER